VKHINNAINADSKAGSKANYIGILDIYGFEIFP